MGRDHLHPLLLQRCIQVIAVARLIANQILRLRLERPSPRTDATYGERRWLVERYFAWLQWKRRILIRRYYYSENFFGFVQLASITMLPK